MLLAVDALDQSNREHTDISPASIGVYCQLRSLNATMPQDAVHEVVQENDEENEVSDEDLDVFEDHGLDTENLLNSCQQFRRRNPFFQLFLERKYCQFLGETRPYPVLGVDTIINVPAIILSDYRKHAGRPHRLAAAEAEAKFCRNGDVVATFRNRLTLKIYLNGSFCHSGCNNCVGARAVCRCKCVDRVGIATALCV